MTITKAALQHSVTVYVLIVVLVLGGAIAYKGLPREAAPEVEIPLVLVSTTYLGVSPQDIESLVTQPLEQELKDIKDIDELRSTSAESASIIQVQFTTDANLDEALQKVREKVDLARPKLPKDAEDPVVQEISTADFPMMIVNITGNYDLSTLKRVAERIQTDIENIPGVMEVKMAGDIEREIQVRVHPHRLNHFQVALHDVVNAIEGENINMPGGDIKVGDASFLVRVPGEFTTVEPMQDIVVAVRDEFPVYLRDVASVHDTFKERTTKSRLDRRDNISLTVTKRPGSNIIAIADDIKSLLDEHRYTSPAGTEIVILGDSSEDIHAMVKELENNMASGLLLVVGVIMLVMGLRNSLLVAVAIPLSMLITFLTLAALGITLNMIVLFSLILALGMLVDNAIVIVENIYRHACDGRKPLEAAWDGTVEVGWPIATSTFTTVAAFFPLLFWPGVEGDFMGYLPKSIIITLVASLFVALVITPVLCAAFLRPKANNAHENSAKISAAAKFAARFFARYERLLRSAVKRRLSTFALVLASLVLTIMIFGAAGLGVEFFPDTTPRKIFVEANTGDGSNLDTSDRAAQAIEAILAQSANIKHFVADVGAGGGQGFGSGSGAVPHQSRVSVDFLADAEQTEPVPYTLERLRQALLSIPGVETELVKEQMGPPGGAPISLEVYGDDFHLLGKLARRIRQRIGNVTGLVDLRDDYSTGRPEIRIHVDREKAKILNASTSMVASTVRTAINGSVASKFRDGEDEYDITVRLAEEFRQDLQAIEALRINVASRTNPNVSYLVPLGEVARIEAGGGTGSIRHKNRKRVVTIEANVDGRLPAAVLEDVQAALADFSLPTGYALDYTGERERQAETQAFLGRAFLIALFLIALILVTQFNSILLPAIIMLAVVLSLVGVLWGQIVLRMPFGIIMTGLGVISLAGVVVNNGIVLVDYIQQLRQRGRDRTQALVEAGLVRLRPVLLTAVTTILGLVPMALGVGIDFATVSLQIGGRSAEFWKPMAIAVISGLIIATVLTLVVVPVLYAMFDDLEQWIRRKFSTGEAVLVANDTPQNT